MTSLKTNLKLDVSIFCYNMLMSLTHLLSTLATLIKIYSFFIM